MEEFNELDKELAKLREELASQSEWGKDFHFPSAGDYWKRRLDEEKDIWRKKTVLKEDEKKELEEKISRQKGQIDEYNQKLKELSIRFEEDSKRWEERLKAKESDLLMEKTRLLWQEKVKASEVENHGLLGKIAELNERIGEIKDTQIAERDKFHNDLEAERKGFEEKSRLYNNEIDVLKKRVSELEADLKKQQEQYLSVTEEYKEKLKKAEDEIAKLVEERNALLKDRGLAQDNLTKTKAEDEKVKAELKENFKQLSHSFVKNLHSYLGPVIGFVHLISNGILKKSSWNLVKDSVQRLENETEMFMTRTDIEFSYGNLYSFAAVMPESELSFWQDISSNNSINMRVINQENLKHDIEKYKPQVLVISALYMNTAKEAKKMWPFLPIIIYGQVKDRVVNKLSKKGFKFIVPPCLTEEVIATLDKTGNHSIAWPEFWPEIKVRKPYARSVLAACLAVALLFSGYAVKRNFMKEKASAVLSYQVPYSQPTNIAFDGQNIWVCDWMGQSLYKHELNSEFEIKRVFYFPEKHLTSITWANGYMWSADSWKKKIYKHNTDEKLTILASYNAPNAAPSGLAGDNRNLWSCDSSLGKIYQHKLDDKLTIEKEYNSPGPNPSGLFYDGEKLWSIDSRTNKIYCHRLDDKLSVEKIFIPPGYEQKGFNLSGIAGTKDSVWICSERMGKVFEYRKEALKTIE
jgi:hypothetical protein